MKTIDDSQRNILHDRFDEFIDAIDRPWIPSLVVGFFIGYLSAWAYFITTILRLPRYLNGFVEEFSAGFRGNAKLAAEAESNRPTNID